MNSVIGIAIVLLVLFGGPIYAALKYAYTLVSSRLPSVGWGFLSAEVRLPIWKVALLIAAFWCLSGGVSWQGCKMPSLPGLPSFVQHADTAVYVYEKDQGSMPAAVMSGLNKLNTERKILATEFEQDTTDGNGKTPEQYVVALGAAKKNGLPSLVATNGPRVLKVTKDPRTEEAVIGGVP